MSHRRIVVTSVAAVAAAILTTSTPIAQANTASKVAPHPPASKLIAGSALPPGESGDFPITSQVKYELDHNPADFGAHVDDQRQLYWNAETKPAGFATPAGTPQVPHAGVRIYRDSYGVPLVYGTNGYDVWYGAGYAAATDRLFEMDAIRRTAEGTLAELTGPSQVPADLAERTITYTPGEYTRMYRHLSESGRRSIAGYSAGVEARIKQVRANPSSLPGEYVLLTSLPTNWSINDSMACGVYMTRSIAAQGGLEMSNVAMLKALEEKYGRHAGDRVFQSLFAADDPKAAVSIHGRRFSNLPKGQRSAAAQRRAFAHAAKWARNLPASLTAGPGTGNAPIPGPPLDHLRSAVDPRIAAEVRAAVASVENWTGSLHGGSFAYALNGRHTKDGHALLVSNPQLKYSYPSELYELEVHGGGYDARGAGVPGLPTVGIGHTATVAWGLTTGYSKTIDSFIERTRPNPKPAGPPQYLHDGKWHNEKCRAANIHYRPAPDGVPVGPAILTDTSRICRTIHGPVVATAKHGHLARAVDYAMWLQEDDNVNAILRWDRAKTIYDIQAGVREETMNENVVAADDKGNIGYWHPGRYFRRPPGTDQRFPLKGSGSQDERGYQPFRDMPHVINPKGGYVANWNTKPAPGWTDGDLSGTNTRPSGPAARVRRI
ncbi:MAG TPA: penicillin acylase family protein, partial [Micromonosporaceae bacterium]